MDYAQWNIPHTKRICKRGGLISSILMLIFNQLALGLWDIIGQMEWMHKEGELDEEGGE